jgi:hypothetical protein
LAEKTLQIREKAVDGPRRWPYNPRLAAAVARPETKASGGFGRKFGAMKKGFDADRLVL